MPLENNLNIKSDFHKQEDTELNTDNETNNKKLIISSD